MREEIVNRQLKHLLVNEIQPRSKENFLMHLEDLESLSLQHKLNCEKMYEKGRNDTLASLSKDLYKSLNLSIPTSSYSAFLNTIQSAIIGESNKSLFYSIECESYELYQLIADTEKILNHVEQGNASEGKLKLKQFKFNVKIRKNEYLELEKQQISEVFKEIYEIQLDPDVSHYIAILKQQVRDLENTPLHTEEFENCIEDFKEYNEKFEISPPSENLCTEEIITIRLQKQQKILIDEKAWEVKIAGHLKEKNRIKQKKLKEKQYELNELERNFKKKNLEIEKERHELDRLKDAYYREKKKISIAMEGKSKKLCEVIGELSENFTSFELMGKVSPITETDMLSDISYMSDCDTSFDNSSTQESDSKQLQQRISELEGQYKYLQTPDSQEKAQRELDTLRNSLTKIRASNVLKSSMVNQKKFLSTRTSSHSLTEPNFKKTLQGQITLFSPRKRVNITEAFKTNSTPKANSQHFAFTEIMPKESEEDDKELRRYLRIQELKLKEKEEKLEKDKEKAMLTWMKLPNANELIPMVQKEILESKKKTEEAEKKLLDYERKVLEFNKKNEENKKKEADLDGKIREVSMMKERLDEEKAIVLDKLERLKGELER